MSLPCQEYGINRQNDAESNGGWIKTIGQARKSPYSPYIDLTTSLRCQIHFLRTGTACQQLDGISQVIPEIPEAGPTSKNKDKHGWFWWWQPETDTSLQQPPGHILELWFFPNEVLIRQFSQTLPNQTPKDTIKTVYLDPASSSGPEVTVLSMALFATSCLADLWKVRWYVTTPIRMGSPGSLGEPSWKAASITQMGDLTGKNTLVC